MTEHVSPVPGADIAAAFLRRRLTAGLSDTTLTRLDAGVGSVVVWLLVLAFPIGMLGRASVTTAGMVLMALAAVALVWSVRTLHRAGLPRSVAFYRGGLLILVGVAPVTLLGMAVSSAGEELTVGVIGLSAALFATILHALHLQLHENPSGRTDDA